MIVCPHAPRCPGCSLIGLPLADQLAKKRLRLTSALASYAIDAAAPPEDIRVADPHFAYRTRAKLAVAVGGRLGLFAAGTHEVVDLPECQVLVPVLARAANAVRALLATPPPTAAALLLRGVADDLAHTYDDTEKPGRLRAIDLREVRDAEGSGVLVTLVVDAPAPSPSELTAACDALEKSIPELRVIALSEHDGRSPQLLGRTPVVLRGTPLQPDRTSPSEPFSYASPGSFAQAHRGQAAAIAREVMKVLAPIPERQILDAFGGSGALALSLARRGATVTLVESFAPAAEAAIRAATEQSLAKRVVLRIGQAEKVLPELFEEGVLFDAAVVNPPRRGVAPSAREALARLCKGQLIYISCEPETLARDLTHLALHGWRTVRLVPFDMIPQTREVECVAVLERGALPKPTVLYEDRELIAVAKPAFLATTGLRDGDDSLLTRVRRSESGAVPLYLLEPDESGVCLFVKHARDADDWRTALADSDTPRRTLALVRGHARNKGRIARKLEEDGHARKAVTRYRRIERLGGHSLVDVTADPGVAHQVRRHLAQLDRPVLGDERYGHTSSNRHLAERYWLDRPFLHCSTATLTHPRTGELLHIEAPLPPDLACVLDRLRASRGPQTSAVVTSPDTALPPRSIRQSDR